MMLARSASEAFATTSAADARWLCVLNLGAPPAPATANLLGPVAFNPNTGAAQQVLLGQSSYSAAHPLESAAACGPEERP